MMSDDLEGRKIVTHLPLKCRFCGHKWVPRQHVGGRMYKSLECPSCKRYHWDAEEEESEA